MLVRDNVSVEYKAMPPITQPDDQLWRANRHVTHHLRHLQIAGGTTTLYRVPTGSVAQVDLGSYTALAVAGKTNHDDAARFISAKLQGSMRVVVAPEPLAMALRTAWVGQAEIVCTDQYMSAKGARRKPDTSLPIKTARALLAEKPELPTELAQCWMRYHNEWHKPAHFAGLLQQTDALVLLDDNKVRAFQLFSDLGRSQIFIGRHCGRNTDVQTLFTQLARRNAQSSTSLLSTCVDVRNGPAIDRLQRAGFTMQPGHRFTTLVLS